ncbi:hypothetical protein ACFYZI_22065 [Streptomyces griseorubiginosus]|uniref:hypothetical protein n=1 Tax=Streptomyces griseorubiginosus TaxID=67304 RepID=UPI003629B2CA
MTRTYVGHVVAMLAVATLAAALPASVPAVGRLSGPTVVEAKADGPGPCCKSVEQAFPRG